MNSDQSPDNVVIKVDTQILTLDPGLYLFRYATEIPEGQQVPATLQASPVGSGQVDFFPGVGVSRNTLRSLGDCVVVRVTRAQGTVLIAKYRVPGRSASVPVQIQVDLVDSSGRFVRSSAKSGPAASPSAPSSASQTERTELQGHVERRGDISAGSGWLGDPSSNARIEGFAVHWYDRPADVDLAYRCYVEGLGESPVVGAGGFAGSRGRGLPIISVTFALNGANASNYEIIGHAAFAGGHVQPIIAGRRLTGPAGREQLCALRVAIAHRQIGEATVPRSPSPWDDPTVTQVFRAGR